MLDALDALLGRWLRGLTHALPLLLLLLLFRLFAVFFALSALAPLQHPRGHRHTKRCSTRQPLHRIAPSRSQSSHSVIACLTGRQCPRPSSSLREACAPCFALHFQGDVIALLWLLE